ncbi:hypothetical protein EVG20_g2118 [Dentipellis fragilis]|uniref:SEC7 domain-containing protein n=1 Tax=Dentipellis fragilis TaxID=205917 RepID=A0A4Y9ZAQ0_9AGAM|nr:hypothetical protein EVG20_g2118 [Dentipellis fragilis]
MARPGETGCLWRQGNFSRSAASGDIENIERVDRHRCWRGRPRPSAHPGVAIQKRGPVAALASAAVVVPVRAAPYMDFEQALRAGGTVVLKEGPDINALGHDSTPSPRPLTSPLSSSSSRTHMPQPSTPTVVPPTPTPTKGKVGSPSGRPRTSSPSVSSSNDVFFDAEDTEYQTKRRSMYRSSGTASSPDLATLVRKAKQRGGILPTHLMRDKTPGATSPSALRRTRCLQYPRTLFAPAAPPFLHFLRHLPPTRVLPAALYRHKGQGEAAESDVLEYDGRLELLELRLGLHQLWRGQYGLRIVQASQVLCQGQDECIPRQDAWAGQCERAIHAGSPSKTPSSPKAPPVPPLPLSKDRSSEMTPVQDVFTTPFSPTAPFSPFSPNNTSKPLPPIQLDDKLRDDVSSFDDKSLVVVERPSSSHTRSRSPEKTVKGKPDHSVRMPGHSKRRSMSVGDVELKKAMAAASSATPLPPVKDQKYEDTDGWDPAMKGLLSDFSQLNPLSTSLDLHVPSTPPRRSGSSRAHAKADMPMPPPVRPDKPKHAASAPPALSLDTPIVTLDPASQTDESNVGSHDSLLPVVPPRSSSLQTPPSRGRSGSNSIGPRAFPSTIGHRPLGPRSPSTGTHAYTGSRDSNRLWVQPRSTAFNSEPSLVPGRDGSSGEYMRHSVQYEAKPTIFVAVPPPLSAISQQDLTFNAPRPFPSDTMTTNSEDAVDLEAKGKDLATRCWDEDEEFLAKEKIAEWLGGVGRVNKIALRHYLDHFDFSGLRLDMAFRRLCAKLFLKAETQQVDRILEEFSRRYWDCNPGNLFGNASVVHAVSYSLLLLNTDLHVAELSSRMSKGQFVRNTLSTIQMQLQSSSDLTYDDSSSIRGAGSEMSDVGTNTLKSSRTKRSDSITSWNSITRDVVIANLGSSLGTSSATPQSAGSGSNHLTNDSSASVSNTNTSGAESKSPSTLVSSVIYDRNWESDMESLLKDMYSAIKNQQVLQPLASAAFARASTSSLNAGPMLRNRSLRVQPDRLATLKRGSIRGIQSLMGPSSGISPYSSNSSVDGRASPSPSFATSTHEGLYGSNLSFLTPTLGFASNLSHTIIRETQEDDDRSQHSGDSESTNISISDEELALLGPPWAKEGMLCRKQYNESAGKRAKSKAWLDVFVVIQKGELNMFTFGGHGHGAHSVVGGGNWLENANLMGTVLLAHSLAHALPPPGYNRQRPHCMVLTLSNGAVYFFQAGTEELVNEWVSTCNYWAARQSKEPLTGGVSNMEYGWNRVGDPLHHGRAISDDESSRFDMDNLSVRSGRSGRSSRSRFGKKDGAATVRGGSSPWADRTSINEWKAPQPPSVPSTHDEETQLEALRKHVTSLTNDLQEHNELRAPMMALYPARSANASKALGNWEKKSQYLLTEIVKYESYIDSLQSAMALRLKKRGEKALERALVGGDDIASTKGKWKGRPEEETILEGDEPSPTAASHPRSPSQQHHRRERAEAEHDSEGERA